MLHTAWDMGAACYHRAAVVHGVLHTPLRTVCRPNYLPCLSSTARGNELVKPKRPSMRRDTSLLSRMPWRLHIGTYGVGAQCSRIAAKAASLKCPGPKGICYCSHVFRRMFPRSKSRTEPWVCSSQTVSEEGTHQTHQPLTASTAAMTSERDI